MKKESLVGCKTDQNLAIECSANNSVENLDAEEVMRAFGKYGKYQASFLKINFVVWLVKKLLFLFLTS